MTSVELSERQAPTSKIVRPQIGLTKIGIYSGRTHLFDAAYPLFGPKNAKSLRDAIRAHPDKLREPNGPESATFLALAYNPEDPNYQGEELSGTRQKTSSTYLRVFEGHLYDGTAQKLFVAEPDFNEDGTIKMPAVSELERRLINGDKSVRVVEFKGLREGKHTPTRIEDSKYIKAVYGEEGAYNLARVADNHSQRVGRVWLPELPSAGQTEIKIAALNSVGGKLSVDGNGDELYRESYASGVFNNRGEATRVA